MKVRKVYLIASFMLILMITIFGVGFSSLNNSISIPSTPTNSDTSDIDDLIEIPKGDNENTSNKEEEKTETTPTFTNGYKCVEYALNILQNGKGYQSTNTITCSGTVLGITEYQYITETKIRSGNYYYKTTSASSTSSLGSSFYRAVYANNKDQMSYRYTSNNDNGQPNWGNSKEDVGTWDYICEKHDNLLYHHLTILPDRTNTTLIKFDRASNKNFYIVTLSLDISKTPEHYIENTIKEGGLDGFKMGSCKFTFYIAKSTGYVVKLIREESYTIQKHGFDVLTKAYSETIFSKMNVELYPEKPY